MQSARSSRLLISDKYATARQSSGGGYTLSNNHNNRWYMQNNKVSKIVCLGYYDSGTGKHQSNTVYHYIGKTPAVTTITGGVHSKSRY